MSFLHRLLVLTFLVVLLKSSEPLTMLASSLRTPRFPSSASWAEAASAHAKRIRSLLAPGLVSNPSASKRPEVAPGNLDASIGERLDPQNPVFNFLVSYYGMKGAKGVRRLCRYSPGANVLMEGVDAGDIPFALPIKYLKFCEGGAFYR